MPEAIPSPESKNLTGVPLKDLIYALEAGFTASFYDELTKHNVIKAALDSRRPTAAPGLETVTTAAIAREVIERVPELDNFALEDNKVWLKQLKTMIMEFVTQKFRTGEDVDDGKVRNYYNPIAQIYDVIEDEEKRRKTTENIHEQIERHI